MRFNIENLGEDDHNLVVRGPKGFLESRPTCEPGGRYTFRLRLRRQGTYSLLCTKADHLSRGHEDADQGPRASALVSNLRAVESHGHTGQVRPRGRGCLRDRDRRARQGGRRAPLPRRRHRRPGRATFRSRRSGASSWTAVRARACRRPSRTRCPIRTGDTRVDVQAALAQLAPEWGFKPAARHRRRRGARQPRARVGHGALVRRPVGARQRACRRSRRPRSTGRQSIPERFLIRWRGEADPSHVKAIDAYWISAAEHGMNASTFTARVVASTGADVAAALSAAVGALSGPAPRRRPVARARRCSTRSPRGRRREVREGRCSTAATA